ELDPARKLARVQPGVVLDELRNAAEQHHLTFAPDPSTHSHNTLGGMIGNNSCGVHSVMGGKTSENLIELDVLTYDGLRLKVRRAARCSCWAIPTSTARAITCRTYSSTSRSDSRASTIASSTT